MEDKKNALDWQGAETLINNTCHIQTRSEYPAHELRDVYAGMIAKWLTAQQHAPRSIHEL